jgi:O-antigen ligase
MAVSNRAQLGRIADWLLVAIAVSLPWSTSAIGILVVLWLVVLIPTLGWPAVKRELLTSSGGLPVLLFLFGAIGMAWADVSLVERWKGLDGFVKLLTIPILIAQCRRSDVCRRVFIGFFISCIVLLIASVVVYIWPNIPKGSHDIGVAVKSYIVQSVEFLICVSGIFYLAVEAGQARRWVSMIGLIFIGLAFLADIFFVATSRTILVIIPVLMVVYGLRSFSWRGGLIAVAAVIVLATALWGASPHLRYRITSIYVEGRGYEIQNLATPTGERIMFWSRSLQFIERAPLIGHGTGSIHDMFSKAAVGLSGARAEAPTNPHNQTFAIAIQIGLIGAVILWAMWVSHFLAFRGVGLVQWMGITIVTQNVVGSLFNSFLFDFTEGWLYVIGIGVTAGTIFGASDEKNLGVRSSNIRAGRPTPLSFSQSR